MNFCTKLLGAESACVGGTAGTRGCTAILIANPLFGCDILCHQLLVGNVPLAFSTSTTYLIVESLVIIALLLTYGGGAIQRFDIMGTMLPAAMLRTDI